MSRVFRILTLCAVTSLAATAASASVNDRPVLDLLGQLEGPEGYTQVVHSAKLDPPRPITQMTIAEVLNYQRALRHAGSSSSAVGRYQFIYKTLRQVVMDFNIDTGQRFNKRTQDFLARRMLEGCDFYDPEASHAAIGNCMARIWAALPVISGSKAGRSYYHGLAGNRALTTPKEVVSLISLRFKDPVYVTGAEKVALSEMPFATRVPLAPSDAAQEQALATVDEQPRDVAPSSQVWLATFSNTDAAAVAVPLE